MYEGQIVKSVCVCVHCIEQSGARVLIREARECERKATGKAHVLSSCCIAAQYSIKKRGQGAEAQNSHPRAAHGAVFQAYDAYERNEERKSCVSHSTAHCLNEQQVFLFDLRAISSVRTWPGNKTLR